MHALTTACYRRLNTVLAISALMLGLGLGGCRNWCHTPSGPQAKGQGARCVTPGELQAARHVN